MGTRVITGVSSFVGHHLALAGLRAGDRVIGVHSTERDGYQGVRRTRLDLQATAGVSHARLDFTQAGPLRELIEAALPDVWIQHAAWATGQSALDYDFEKGIAVGVTPLDALCELLRAHDCRGLIVTGSSAEYADADVPHREDETGTPALPYGRAKLAATVRARALSQQHGLRIRVARLFMPFGPLDAPGKLLPSVLASLSRSESFELSECTQARDFVHVDDVVRGYDALIADLDRDCAFDVFNLSSGVGHSLRDVLLHACRELGADSELLGFGKLPRRPAEPEVLVGDAAKARRVLRWQPDDLWKGISRYARDF